MTHTMHTLSDCPLGSAACITIDEENRVTGASEEMERLLGCKPIDQTLDQLWTFHSPFGLEESRTTAVSHHTSRTLSLCVHPHDKGHTIVCSDSTGLQRLDPRYRQVSILRLSMYGTVEAAFPNATFPICQSWVGEPVMRYVGAEDVKKLCAALSRATRLSCLVQLHLDLQGQPSDWTLMYVEDQDQVLCFIRPPGFAYATHTALPLSLYHILCHTQARLWQCLDQGFHWAAQSIAYTLLLLLENAWPHYQKGYHLLLNKKPELESLCSWFSYLGIPQHTSKAWLDRLLDSPLDKQHLIV
ncbi:hypothetical protein BY458DRAFT_519958 [Sporodiniella umbellata]|nr:hypothetical protein BY458DRAFT_519958 [Sporodiniella umbellata]